MSESITHSINQHLAAAEKLIWFAIEREVKAVLQDPKNGGVTGFISAMGGYFWIAGDSDVKSDEKIYPWQAPIDAIYDKYNDAFKMYGAGVRWDLVDGKVIKSTDW